MCNIKELPPNIVYSAKILLPPAGIPPQSRGCMLLLLNQGRPASAEENIFKGTPETLKNIILEMNKKHGFSGINECA